MTLIFAHRGYSKKYPENTMRSFLMAERFGADGIELDVHLSSDGELIVIHDETINRTTNGSGFVSEFTARELKEFKIKGMQSESVPILDEVLQWIVSTDLFVNIELKTDKIMYPDIERKVINLVKKYQLIDRVTISSFNSDSLSKIRKICPEIEVAFLYDFMFDNPYILAKLTGVDALHPRSYTIANAMITYCQNLGVAIRPYTVNKVHELERLFQVNCAGVITDDPFLACKIRSELSH